MSYFNFTFTAILIKCYYYFEFYLLWFIALFKAPLRTPQRNAQRHTHKPEHMTGITTTKDITDISSTSQLHGGPPAPPATEQAANSNCHKIIAGPREGLEDFNWSRMRNIFHGSRALCWAPSGDPLWIIETTKLHARACAGPRTINPPTSSSVERARI